MYENRADKQKKNTKIDVAKYAPQPKQQVMKHQATIQRGKTKRRKLVEEDEQVGLDYAEFDDGWDDGDDFKNMLKGLNEEEYIKLEKERLEKEKFMLETRLLQEQIENQIKHQITSSPRWSGKSSKTSVKSSPTKSRASLQNRSLSLQRQNQLKLALEPSAVTGDSEIT